MGPGGYHLGTLAPRKRSLKSELGSNTDQLGGLLVNQQISSGEFS